ncbi:MAG: 3-octaprenyl-4-hydroxybenzoate carboxy-lyase [Zetaproteobacteria bacterium CG12_big_fil_rev_8_21_14_0_65_54_13]|nr:MAG: 3-octaprenyl-4-hydroxybenzoate carboxy-lyase [Zetaproteobacteria bacterium CG12_big_fil_rev_8_21_14_0_65_54_13]PIX54246.1 MAG: 3-octaprenyl-4-hydroxybenzoate carboxy-lyase [Zetaproteobacteria bacterium CG_4_10_14_3_um_filter_54_28]PJA28389.1 MAG: 3-octaprenyl-4-hydroxybenzoate carboxy-lyase [Zetaproteobacteria bacterium CG_4_9_14_3_um_filter_54_145]
MTNNQQTLDDIAEKIAGGIRLLGGLKQGAEEQVRSIVEGALSQFDVVTHERMQVQEAMLKKSRDELAALDARVHELEAKIKELSK